MEQAIFTDLNPWIASNSPYEKFSLGKAILGTIFAPLMWLIGVRFTDIMLMGGKTFGHINWLASEFHWGTLHWAELKI